MILVWNYFAQNIPISSQVLVSQLTLPDEVAAEILIAMNSADTDTIPMAALPVICDCFRILKNNLARKSPLIKGGTATAD